uniref:Uncharacterized protein n=1 Tax=Acrobeloides nanus TaxID=290746 RepID=A0A914D9Q6_9BILA
MGSHFLLLQIGKKVNQKMATIALILIHPTANGYQPIVPNQSRICVKFLLIMIKAELVRHVYVLLNQYVPLKSQYL